VTDNKIQKKLLKAIINADLTKSEIKIISLLLDEKDKFFIINNSELAKKMGFSEEETHKKIPNIVRTITDLKLKNIIKTKMVNKKETDKVYVSLFKDWKSKDKK
tara:strand:+ start:252 stop:563 length:312 start_codon:yes stop_codon:yes gene_type:complete